MPGENDFDIGAAVDEIGAGLGFGDEGGNHGTDDDVDLQVDLPGSGDRDPGDAAGGSADGVGTADPTTKTVGSDGNPGDPATTGDPATDPAAADPAAEPPKTWRKEAAELWKTLPAAARQEIIKREADIFKGIEGYKTEAAFGKSFREVLSPFMPIMEQYNLDPAVQVRQLLQAHQTLALGTPEQKSAFFAQLAQQYQIPLPGSADEPAYVDPAVKDLQSQVQSLHSKLSEADASRQAQVIAERQKEVETFAADPSNLHFDEVSNDMVTLLQGGVCKTLPEAYEKAVWANPVTRAKEIARQQAEATRKAQETEAAKVAAARKATAANVRTSAKSGSATAPLGSIDDTLNETLAKIRSGP